MKLHFNNREITYTLNPVTIEWRPLLFALDELVEISTIDLPRGVQEHNGMIDWNQMVDLVDDVIPGDYGIIMNNLLTSMRQGGDLTLNPNGTVCSVNPNAVRQALEAAANPATDIAARARQALEAAATLPPEDRARQALEAVSHPAELSPADRARQALEAVSHQPAPEVVPAVDTSLMAQQRLQAAAQQSVPEITLMGESIERRRRNGLIEVNVSQVAAAYGETLRLRDVVGLVNVSPDNTVIESGVVWTNALAPMISMISGVLGYAVNQSLVANLFQAEGGNLNAWGQYC